MTHPALFTINPDLLNGTQDDSPRCPMCARTRRWNPRRNEWHRCCGGNTCNNPDRLCQSCGKQFAMNINGAGNKYCSTECKKLGYTVAQGARARPNCEWCDTPATYQRAGIGSVWPYVCKRCMTPLRYVVTRLRDHRVPLDRVRLLLTNPGCETCGIDIVNPARSHTPGAGRAALLAVDHDHNCCAGAHSCGKCVRGLICGNCNTALGLAHNDAATLRRLADYLDAYGSATRINQ